MDRHVIIVCGYGCHLVSELQDYLYRVIRFVNENKIDYIIFCGGFTQRKTAPGISEAQLMHDYVVPKLKYQPHCLLEDESYTTLENIRNATRYFYLFNKMKETIFCEAMRALKVDMLAKYYFGHRVNIETVSWELMRSEKEIMAVILDWFAMRFPSLANYLHWKRIQRAEKI